MATKITKRDNFNELKALATEMGRIDLVEFIDHEIELLDRKKSNGNSKANKQVADNVEIVYNALVEYGKSATITELIANTDLTALKNEDGIVSTQRISAYMKKLVDGGRVVSTKDKKKTYFSVVTTESVDEE